MKYQKSLKVSIRIIFLFSTAILLSFIPDLLHSFFGDYKCQGYYYDWSANKLINGSCDFSTNHNSKWHWGYRHWLWLSMGICLALIQVVNIINLVDSNEVK